MDDERACALIFGVAVARRFRQRRRMFPLEDADALVALAASDIWQVIQAGADDPLRALDEYLEAEEVLL